MYNSKYNFEFQIVKPLCSGLTSNWCPITKRCESKCAVDFASKMYSPNDADSLISGKSECKIGTEIEQKGYCSNEQTCFEDPTSFDQTSCPKSFECNVVFICRWLFLKRN